MGAIKFPHTSGNSMSIAAPATNPASDLELKLPATVGTAGQVLKNSSTAGTLEFGAVDGDGIAKVWVNFDGAAGTPSINASYGVNTITDNGTGDYTVNFTSNFADNDYCFVGMAQNGEGATNPDSHVVQSAYFDGQAVGSFRVCILRTRYDAVPPQFIDSKAVCVAFFR
jgi:hypothetical protein